MKQPWFLDLAPHEAEGYLNYKTGDLGIFETLANVIAPASDEKVMAAFQSEGRLYRVRLTAKKSGLQPPENSTFNLDMDAETVPEYVLSVRPEDGVGGEDDDTRSFILHPRWPGMGTAYDPDFVGVSVEFHGVNDPLDAYPDLFTRALGAFGVEAEGFERHSGVITTFEMYPRIHADYSGPLVRRGGVLDRLDAVTTSKMGTDRPVRDNRGTVGRHREVDIPSADAGNLFEGHSVGTTVKHYFGKFLRSRETAREGDDPLAHAKLGVCFKKGLTDGEDLMLTTNGAVRWEERDRLVREIEERVLSLLGWAGLPTRAKDHRDVFVPDHYFEAEDRARDLRLFDDPTESLSDDQRSWVDAALIDRKARPSESEVAVIDVLADDGSAPVDVVADKAEVSERTVYRAAENNPRLLRVHNSVAGFVTDVVRRAIGSIRERSGRLIDQLRSGTEDSNGVNGVGANSHRSTFIEKMAEWGVVWDDKYPNKPQFNLGRLPQGVKQKDVMDDLYRAWCRSGRDRDVFHRASSVWGTDDEKGYQPRYKARR